MGKKEELKGGKGNKAEASKEPHGKKKIIINWTLNKNKYGSKDSPVPDRFLKSQNYSSRKQKTPGYKSQKCRISSSTIYHCSINRADRKACWQSQLPFHTHSKVSNIISEWPRVMPLLDGVCTQYQRATECQCVHVFLNGDTLRSFRVSCWQQSAAAFAVCYWQMEVKESPKKQVPQQVHVGGL